MQVPSCQLYPWTAASCCPQRSSLHSALRPRPPPVRLKPPVWTESRRVSVRGTRPLQWGRPRGSQGRQTREEAAIPKGPQVPHHQPTHQQSTLSCKLEAALSSLLLLHKSSFTPHKSPSLLFSLPEILSMPDSASPPPPTRPTATPTHQPSLFT